MPNCVQCKKGVYPMDPQVSLDGSLYHKTCAKCGECGCQITISNFTKVDDSLLCKTHYLNKFKESGGKYAGGEKYRNNFGKTLSSHEHVTIEKSYDPTDSEYDRVMDSPTPCAPTEAANVFASTEVLREDTKEE